MDEMKTKRLDEVGPARKLSCSIIAFTRRGCALANNIVTGLGQRDEFADTVVTVSGPARFSDEFQIQAYESLASWTAEQFGRADALLYVGATGIAVRAIAPHVRDKFSDPAVVSIDEAGRFAVPLLSGHVGGANELARTVAELCGGQAVVSTATDVNELFAVDEWAARRGFSIVERVLAKQVSARLLEGGKVGFASDFDLDWEVPAGIMPLPGVASAAFGMIGTDADADEPGVVASPADADGSGNVDEIEVADSPETDGMAIPDLGFAVSLDDTCHPFERTLHLVPRIATVGVGCRKGADPAVLERSVDTALASAHVSPLAVKLLASIDVKSEEPAILQLAEKRGWDLRFYTADELNAVPGDFDSSDFVRRTVGVDNVCERAALAQGGRLLLGKQAGNGTTVAIAMECDNLHSVNCHIFGKDEDMNETGSTTTGKLYVVGLGPGGADDMTMRAHAAIEACDLIAGYTVYVDLLRDQFPDKEILTTPMRKEVDRCRKALEAAAQGRSVAMVCSGDPGVYGMAGLIYELAHEYDPVDIAIIPGVSASTGGAAVLGAPLMHDWCAISLSDLLTPWEKIEQRLTAAAQADFVISLYNPSSHKRPDYLQRACDILLAAGKDPATICGTVRNIGREGEKASIMTLAELRDTRVDMFTCVFIGNSQTQEIEGHMVTPRGYLQRED